jgi:uncharacterized membrane-anchored protein YjiN (DUF445 family)
MKPANGKKSDEIRKKREAMLARLNARIAEAQRLEDNRERKELTRYKIMVGACVLSDLEKNPDLGEHVEDILQRNANERDREFLRTKGWRL